ncbi:hypothetical protein ZHAS_00008832 [Anopheles sinensis]|uniref:Uncharacterized protein n=1 Tax=Anopheles sinensis TaxID=74873 RepID=A0A084VTE9_ANOSI|nr:hypothetical protein ZHAS_00008832 [Anopheles sinensis]
MTPKTSPSPSRIVPTSRHLRPSVHGFDNPPTAQQAHTHYLRASTTLSLYLRQKPASTKG